MQHQEHDFTRRRPQLSHAAALHLGHKSGEHVLPCLSAHGLKLGFRKSCPALRM